MIHEFEYTKEHYKSRVHDYGDEYHIDDTEEIEKNILLKRVKNCKRRYRDFGEYCDACEVINDYMEYLVDKWGGKKRFKFFLKVGLITDFLPAKPKLKKTKYNYKYIKEGVDRIETEHFNNVIGKPLPPESKKIKIKFKFKNVKDDDKIFDLKYTTKSVRENLGMGINDIQTYYSDNLNKIYQRNSKKKLKKKIKEHSVFNDDEQITMEEVEREYYRKLDAREFDDEEDPDKVFAYKGTYIRKEEYDELVAIDLMKAAGIIKTKKVLSKKSRSLVKSDKKKEKQIKKMKKKEKKMHSKIYERFKKENYETFDEFTNEIMTVVGSDCGRY